MMTLTYRQSILLRIVANFDQQIATVESALLATHSQGEAHRYIEASVNLRSAREMVEEKLKDCERE